MTDLPFLVPDPDPPRPARPSRCRHPREHRTSQDGGWVCRCGHVASAAKVRQGRTARARGNAKERRSAQRNGTVRTGHHGGKDDFRRGMFAFQNKSLVTARFPGWMSRELDALRLVWSGYEPVLHIEESPGPGRRPRRLYVVDEKTWFATHGPTEVE